MDERTTGLILRTRPLTESSLIVHWLTPDVGRISTVAKGARRPKSPFLGKLDFGYLAEFSYRRNRRSDLHNLSEVAVREFNLFLRENLALLNQAAYATALVECSTEIDTPMPEIYKLTLDFFESLSARPTSAVPALAFEVKLLAILGLSPKPELKQLKPGTAALLDRLAQFGWNELPRLKFSPAQTAELAAALGQFLAFHLPRVPRNRPGAISGT